MRKQSVDGSITIREAQPNEKPECESILRALPEWFGIESAITAYMTEIEEMPTFIALDGEQLIGFLALNFHNDYTAEVHVMGIRPQFHGRGFRPLEELEDVWPGNPCLIMVKRL